MLVSDPSPPAPLVATGGARGGRHHDGWRRTGAFTQVLDDRHKGKAVRADFTVTRSRRSFGSASESCGRSRLRRIPFARVLAKAPRPSAGAWPRADGAQVD